MKTLFHKIKEYLNESTTIFKKKRYKTILGFLIFQIWGLDSENLP